MFVDNVLALVLLLNLNRSTNLFSSYTSPIDFKIFKFFPCRQVDLLSVKYKKYFSNNWLILNKVFDETLHHWSSQCKHVWIWNG